MISVWIPKILLVIFLGLAATGFADQFVVDNQTKYPTQKTKMAVQWANSAKQVEEGNLALIQGSSVNPDTLRYLSKPGKMDISIPQNAQYFRVLVWTQDQDKPDLHTNWVDVVPNKTYTLKQDQLVPTPLIHGTGC